MPNELQSWWECLSENWKSELGLIRPVNLELFTRKPYYLPIFKNNFEEITFGSFNDPIDLHFKIQNVNSMAIGFREIDYPAICHQIENLEPLTKFINLEALWIFSDIVFDYQFADLSKLSKLRALELQTRNLKNLDFLKHLEHLEYLSLSASNISNLDPLKNLNKLKCLDLSGTSVNSIQCIFDKPLSFLCIADTLVPLKEISLFKKHQPDCKLVYMYDLH